MKFEMAFDQPLQALSAGLYHAPEGQMHPERVIDSTELIFVQSGVLGMREEQAKFIVRPGQTLILHPERRHAGTLEFPPNLSVYWIHFRVSRGTNCKNRGAWLKIPQHAQLKQPERMTEFFRRYIEDQASGKQDPIQASLLIMMMLAEIQREDPAQGRRVTTLALRAQRYIHEFFYEPISTHSIAGELKCNPDYLGRTYRQSFGHGITEGIHLRRMQVAKEALIYNTGNINDIARDCGYASTIYFRRMFMRHVGSTPGGYRRLYSRGFK